MKRKRMVWLIIAVTIGVILFATVDISISKSDTRNTSQTVEKNGKKYRITTWSKSGFIFTEQGWSRQIDKGNGWELIDEGKGKCPFSTFLLSTDWARDE